MKQILFVFLLFSVIHFAFARQNSTCQQNLCTLDSIDMPIYFVDGVEVNNLDSISNDDIISFKVVRDANMLKYFRPRMGALIFIKTKSRKFLTPILREYEEKLKEQRESCKEKKNLIR